MCVSECAAWHVSLVRAVSTVSRHAHARQREGLGGGEDGAEVQVSALEAGWVAAPVGAATRKLARAGPRGLLSVATVGGAAGRGSSPFKGTGIAHHAISRK